MHVPWPSVGILAGTAALIYLLWPSSARATGVDIPQVQADDRIWVIGDSQAVGLIPELRKLSAAQGGVPVVDGDALGGTAVFQWVKWPSLLSRIQKGKDAGSTYVLVVLGTNDSAMDTKTIGAVREQEAIQKLVSMLADLGMTVVWVGPPTLPANPCANESTIVDMIMSSGVPYLDTREIELPMWRTKSGEVDVHPTIEGRKIWARWIWDKIGGAALAEGT